MPELPDRIDFQHMGIGTALKDKRLRVPPNQREYAWEDTHVKDLLNDFANAIQNNKATYFLGTIVLTRGSDGIPEVSDGQQRLATTTILLAAIRDWFLGHGQETKARSIEEKFLGEIDDETDERVPKLTLNDDDNDYFKMRVLSRPDSEDRKVMPRYESNQRIDVAAKLAAEHVEKIVAPLRETDRADALQEWVKFIREGAQVFLLTVPDDLNTFLMFETLNDRGLRVSQADLVKNYLMSRAGSRMGEVRQRWSRMLGALESAREDDIAMTYLRHQLVTMYGPTKNKEVFDRIKADFSSPAQVLQFATLLADGG